MRHLFSKQWVVEVDVLVVLLAVAPEAVLPGPKAVSPASAKSSSTESAVEVDILVVLLAVPSDTVLGWSETVSSSTTSKAKPSESELWSRAGEVDHQEHQDD